MPSLHVFICPNPISLLISQRVIKEMHLEESNPLILLTRNMEVPECIKKNVAQFPFRDEYFPHTKKLHRCWKALKHFDSWVRSTIPMEYVLYLPHDRRPIYQIFASHQYCREVSYIEEGVLAYYTLNELSKIPIYSPKPKINDAIIAFFGYAGRNRGYHVPLYSRLCSKTYCVNHKAFPWSSNKHVVSDAFNLIDTSSSRQNPKLILALTEFQSDGAPLGWSREAYEASVAGLTQYCLEKSITQVGIKSHPAQCYTRFEKGLAKSYFERAGIIVRHIPQTHYLETNLSDADLSIVVIDSSLLIYRYFFDGKVIPLAAFHSKGAKFVRDSFSSWPETIRLHLIDLYENISESIR